VKIAINKAHYPITVLGPGRRIGIWLQGCSIRCKGCVSQDTWATDPAREIPVAQLMSWCRTVGAAGFDGVTISGGEPFDQPKALAALLNALDHWRNTDRLNFDILCYSGYPLATLQKRHGRLLARLDALIPEPFVDALPLTHKWRGSANQTLVALSPRGQACYAEAIEAPADELDKRIQVSVDDGRIWYVGIPARGDMAAMESSCRERGVDFAQVSWRQ
jgi:anaerobic ribonucleoside-triphosphate reductase activating protein